jgi:hypothetical protein
MVDISSTYGDRLKKHGIRWRYYKSWVE